MPTAFPALLNSFPHRARLGNFISCRCPTESVPTVVAVNNYSTRAAAQELVDSLVKNGASTRLLEWRDVSRRAFNSGDAVVLSGSPAMLSKPDTAVKFERELDAIIEAKVPLFGVCFGMQLMGLAFGSRVVRARRNTKKYVETEVLVDDPLFAGLPKKITVFESHLEKIDRVPDCFEVTARSGTAPIAALRHTELPLEGVQFHPERNSLRRPDGDKVIRNFVAGLRR